jgi:hypothetical protein
LEPLLDRLVYEVLADDLLPESQKSQLSQSLAARKREPLETWEYAQLVAASEEVVQKRWELSYNRQLAALAVLATLLVGLHLENGRLPVTITEGLIDFSLSFGVLVGLYSIWSLNRRPVAYIPAVGGESRQSQQQNSQHQESDSLEGLPQYSDLPAPASPQDEHQNSTEDEEASLFHPSYQAL